MAGGRHKKVIRTVTLEELEPPKPDMGNFRPKEAHPKKCPACKAWMDEKASNCPYCDFLMVKHESKAK